MVCGIFVAELYVIGGRRCITPSACPVFVEKFTTRTIRALEGVGAEIVALSLHKGCREAMCGQ